MLLIALIALLSAANLPFAQGATCAQQTTIDGCVTTSSLLKSNCSPTDYKCLCTAYTAIWGCYNSCPTSPERTSAQSSMMMYCKAATTTTTAARTTPSDSDSDSDSEAGITTTYVTSIATVTASPTGDSSQQTNNAQGTSTDEDPPDSSSTSRPRSGVTVAVGIAAGIVVGIVILGFLGFLLWRQRLKKVSQNTAIEISSVDYSRREIDGTEVQPSKFELAGSQQFNRQLDDKHGHGFNLPQGRQHFVAELPAESYHRPPQELHGSHKF